MSGICKTCQHWLPPAIKTEPERFGLCLLVPFKGGANKTTHNGQKQLLDPESVLSDGEAYTTDGSDYYSCLQTGPLFGCNQHKYVVVK